MNPTRAVVPAALVVLGLTACQGSVSDPANDGVNGLEIVSAGVDYRSDTTTFTIQYARGSVPGDHKGWSVSVDGDTTAEISVSIGTNLGGALDQYAVTPRSASSPVCQGSISNGGYDGNGTVSLTVSSRCLVAGDSAPLPPTLRIAAGASTYRHVFDGTDWSPAVNRS